MPKVLYIGFGIAPYTTGGAVAYQDSLMEGVNRRGWGTTAFFSAPRYTLGGRLHLRAWYKGGTRFIEFRNPPYVVESQGDPEQQCSDPVMERLTNQVLDEEKPDLVHIHELQFHPARVIDIISNRGIPVVKTMHNYYDVCSQRDLMYQGEVLCSDTTNEVRCAECLSYLPPASVSLKQRIAGSLSPSLIGLCRTIKGVFEFRHARKAGQVAYGIKVHRPEQYRDRRRFFVERLNKLDLIHCSSHRMAQILVDQGILKEKIRVITLSTQTIDVISPKPLRDSRHPVVFGFTGGKALRKGYRVLIDAFSRLDQSKAKLIVWGTGETGMLNTRLSVELRRYYDPGRINQVFQEIDVGIVPSVWEESFGIIGVEMLTARIPVIGSRIGGITEWLKEGENGFLVDPNNAGELAQKMELFVRTPVLIGTLQARIKPWKRIGEHIDEMISVYKEVMG